MLQNSCLLLESRSATRSPRSYNTPIIAGLLSATKPPGMKKPFNIQSNFSVAMIPITLACKRADDNQYHCVLSRIKVRLLGYNN